ncbi:MAG: carboxypeptidase-like regulatory domain-containing protein [bacterium]
MSDNESKNFWLTIPGIITGISAFVTAIGGLLIALHQTGLLGRPNNPSQQIEIKRDKVYVVGNVRDESGNPLSGATIIAINTDNKQEIGKETADTDGSFEMKLEFDRNKDRIKLITQKDGYEKYTIVLGTEQVSYPSILLKSKN